MLLLVDWLEALAHRLSEIALEVGQVKVVDHIVVIVCIWLLAASSALTLLPGLCLLASRWHLVVQAWHLLLLLSASGVLILVLLIGAGTLVVLVGHPDSD